jgi:hypothetical protein
MSTASGEEAASLIEKETTITAEAPRAQRKYAIILMLYLCVLGASSEAGGEE